MDVVDLILQQEEKFLSVGGKKLYITIAITDKMEIIMGSFTTNKPPSIIMHYYVEVAVIVRLSTAF